MGHVLISKISSISLYVFVVIVLQSILINLCGV